MRVAQPQFHNMASAHVDRIERSDLPPFNRAWQETRIKDAARINHYNRMPLGGTLEVPARDVGAEAEPDCAEDLRRCAIEDQHRHDEAPCSGHEDGKPSVPAG